MGPFADGWSREQVEQVIARDEPEEVLHAPIVVGMNAPDCGREWAESVCFRLARHEHFNVRGNAVLGLAHIARTCRALNTEIAIPLVSRALEDPHEYVRSHASSAVEDLEHYLGVVLPRSARGE
jgi:hypothetical protein